MEELKTNQQQKLKKMALIMGGIFILIFGATYLISQPNFFRGEVLQQLSGGTPGTADLYIPTSYTAAPGQVGEIEIISTKTLSINAMEFTLAYDKAKLEVRELVLAGTPLAAFTESINTNVAQGAKVVLVSAGAVTVNAGSVLKIKVALPSTIPDATEVPIQIVNPVIYDGNLNETIPTSNAGKITISGSAVSDTGISIQSVSPTVINNNSATTLTINGQNFLDSDGNSSSLQVYLNDLNPLTIISATNTQITASVPSGLVPNIPYQLIIENDQSEPVTVNNIVTVVSTSSSQISIVQANTKMVPPQIPNDGVSKASLFVSVKDPNGIDDIISNLGGTDPFQAVTANLGPLNQGINVPLPFVGKSGDMAIFKLDITVDSRVATSETPYKIAVTARNRIGQEVTGNIDVLVKRQVLGGIAPKIIQAHASPEEGVSGQAISFYVEVEDQDGTSDISSVILNFVKLGSGLGPLPLVPLELSQGALSLPIPNTSTASSSGTSPSTSTVAETRKWYGLFDLNIPDEVLPGRYTLDLTVSDSSNQRATSSIRLDVLSPEEVAFKPIVHAKESYTTPLAAINDEKSPISLYTLIEHKNPLASVIVNLGNVARVHGADTGLLPTNNPTPPPFSADVFDAIGNETALPPVIPNNGSQISPPAETICPTLSDTIVCMNLTARIGKEKTWASLSDVVIRKHISPSIDPYLVQVIATDIYGNSGEGYMPIIVHDGSNYTSDEMAPTLKLATSTSREHIELVFSEALDPGSVAPSGRDFSISFDDNISIKLPVVGATINAAGTIVTLKTAPQEEARYYSVTVGTGVTDAIGIPIVRGGNSQARFIGFVPSDYPVRLDYVTSTSPQLVELEFYKPIRPSSVELTANRSGGALQAPTLGSNLSRKGSTNFRIQNAETGEDLAITSVSFGSFGNIMVLGTATQKAGQKYFVNVRDIATYSGIYIKTAGITKFFKGFVQPFAQLTDIWNQADFDQNGIVNFADFTIFASLYGKERASEIGVGTDPTISEPTIPSEPTNMDPNPDLPNSEGTGQVSNPGTDENTVPVSSPPNETGGDEVLDLESLFN